VFSILIGLDVNPDTAVYLSADPVPDSGTVCPLFTLLLSLFKFASFLSCYLFKVNFTLLISDVGAKDIFERL
jgi:hypothetical protein